MNISLTKIATIDDIKSFYKKEWDFAEDQIDAIYTDFVEVPSVEENLSTSTSRLSIFSRVNTVIIAMILINEFEPKLAAFQDAISIGGWCNYMAEEYTMDLLDKATFEKIQSKLVIRIKETFKDNPEIYNSILMQFDK